MAKKKKQEVVKCRGGNNKRNKNGGGNYFIDTFAAFQKQLAGLQLSIRDVKGDGNCLFRSLADQMEGDVNQHATYRHTIVEFMLKNPDDFEPFIDTDEHSFLDYCKKMSKNGEWGGNMELVSFSRCFNTHVIVHQLATAALEIMPPPSKSGPQRKVHLSYHDNQHYCSVRNVNDKTNEAATAIEVVFGKAVEEKKDHGKKSGARIEYEKTKASMSTEKPGSASKEVTESDGDENSGESELPSTQQPVLIQKEIAREIADRSKENNGQKQASQQPRQPGGDAPASALVLLTLIVTAGGEEEGGVSLSIVLADCITNFEDVCKVRSANESNVLTATGLAETQHEPGEQEDDDDDDDHDNTLSSDGLASCLHGLNKKDKKKALKRAKQLAAQATARKKAEARLLAKKAGMQLLTAGKSSGDNAKNRSSDSDIAFQLKSILI